MFACSLPWPTKEKYNLPVTCQPGRNCFCIDIYKCTHLKNCVHAHVYAYLYLLLSLTHTHMCTCIQTCMHTCMCTSRATTRLERLLSRFWQAGYLCVMFVESKQLFAVSLSMLKTHTALHPFCLHPADYQVFALWCVTWVAKEETSQSSCSFEFMQEDGGKDSLGSNIMRKWF